MPASTDVEDALHERPASGDVSSMSPRLRKRRRRRQHQASPVAPPSAAETVEPQERWHIMPDTENGRHTRRDEHDGELLASKPTSSTAATKSVARTDAEWSTVAEPESNDARAKRTPSTSRSAAETVEPQERWHIIPDTDSVVARDMCGSGGGGFLVDYGTPYTVRYCTVLQEGKSRKNIKYVG